jgi:predicted GNAT superfamily acetyltransferase
MQGRNAHFNLNRLGVLVESYGDNFYGTDYNADPDQKLDGNPGLQSDRLFANWYLDSERVVRLSRGEDGRPEVDPVGEIAIPAEWAKVLHSNLEQARAEQVRVRHEFKSAFAERLVCAAFERGQEYSKYLLFRRDDV